MIQQTSLDAYKYARKQIAERQARVMGCLRADGPMSDQEIADRLGLPINCITGRRNELWRMGYVLNAGTKKNVFGRSVMVWEINR